MRIVFWNINRKSDVEIIHQLVEKSTPDLLFLAECPDEMVSKIDSSFPEIKPPVTPPKSDPKVRGFNISNIYQIDCVNNDFDRYWFYVVEKDDKIFLLGTVHLIDQRNHDKHAQCRVARDAMEQIQRHETAMRSKTQNTILIGDFNMNPFDPGMVVADGFNSVCSLEIAKKRSRKVSNKDYTYFYNPSWKIYAGIGNHIHGTYYYRRCDGGHTFHWNNLDQVLLRPSILEKYDHCFEVLHNTLDFDLRKSNNSVSDHYPILLEIKDK
jgi:exonuclease III